MIKDDFIKFYLNFILNIQNKKNVSFSILTSIISANIVTIKGRLFQPRARAMQWDTGEFKWNNLTTRDMQQFLSNLYSFIYILMVLKIKVKKQKSRPSK